MTASVGVIIPTHQRREDLTRTLGILAQLDPAPDEIIITADGCRDGTVDFVQAEYPRVKLIVNETSRGSTASRDTMMREARSELILSLDDDSYPIEVDAVARLRTIFAARPRLAVASFPQRTDESPATLTQTDFGAPHFAGTYVNCACAFRRAVVVELGGHFGPFWNAYDEPDFAARCISAGWEVRWEPAITIRHHYSGVNRNELRMHHQHARNEFWSALMRCPAPQLFAVILFRAVRQFTYACQRGPAWVMREPLWWWQALCGAPRSLGKRQPLPWRSYFEWMRLVRQPIFDEQEWQRRFR